MDPNSDFQTDYEVQSSKPGATGACGNFASTGLSFNIEPFETLIRKKKPPFTCLCCSISKITVSNMSLGIQNSFPSHASLMLMNQDLDDC